MTSWDQAIAPMKIDMNRRNYHILSFRSNTSSYISPRIYIRIYIIIIIIYIYIYMHWWPYSDIRKSHPMAMPTRSSTADLLGSCISVTLLRWENQRLRNDTFSKIYVWYIVWWISLNHPQSNVFFFLFIFLEADTLNQLWCSIIKIY